MSAGLKRQNTDLPKERKDMLEKELTDTITRSNGRQFDLMNEKIKRVRDDLNDSGDPAHEVLERNGFQPMNLNLDSTTTETK